MQRMVEKTPRLMFYFLKIKETIVSMIEYDSFLKNRNQKN